MTAPGGWKKIVGVGFEMAEPTFVLAAIWRNSDCGSCGTEASDTGNWGIEVSDTELPRIAPEVR